MNRVSGRVWSRVERPLSEADVAALEATVRAFETRYGVPSAQMTDVAEFHDERGRLVETADLLAWSSACDRLSLARNSST